MDGLKSIYFIILSLGLLAACVPDPSNSKSCGPSERLNSSTRTCVPLISAPANNFAPVGIDESITTVEDTPISFTIVAATDVNNDPLTYSVVTLPAQGSLTDCMDRPGSSGPTDLTCVYTPLLNDNVTRSITYKVNDGYQDSAAVSVTINITPVNDGPSLLPVSVVFQEDTPYTYAISALNTLDPEGDLPSSCSAFAGVNLTLGLCTCTGSTCSVVLTPFANLNWPSSSFSFQMTVTAGGTSPTLTQSVIVVPNNDPPVLTDAACLTTLNQGSALSCTLPSATDVDTGDTLTFDKANGVTDECSWINIDPSTGALSGNPLNGDVGPCNFQYQVIDSQGATDVSALLSFNVINLVPIITAGASSLTAPTEDGGKTLIGKLSSLSGCTEAFCLSQDRVQDGTPSIDTSSTCQWLEIVPSTADVNIWEINMEPPSNYSNQTGFCSVVVKFDDGHVGGTATASLSTNIKEINDPPTMTAVTTQTTNEATVFVVDTDTNTTLIDPIILSEGGGIYEYGETLTLKIQSSNTALIPHSNINIRAYADDEFTSSFTFVSANATGVTYQKIRNLSDPIKLYLALTPSPGVTGSASITLTLSDNGKTNGVLAPGSATPQTFTVNVANNSAIHNDWKQIYSVGARILHTGHPDGNPSVKLSWNEFTAISGTISSYAVFRSTNLTGPFIAPLTNCESISTTSLTCTDSTLTEADEGVTYYYRVKAVAAGNSKLMETSSSYATIRVIIPPHNMALVHRRMANHETCTLMGKTPDRNNNNRCNYIGPGDNYSGYYDIGQDHFVDRYEASCNFTQNNIDCIETNGAGCIGNDTPSTVSPSQTSEAIYYNRLTGKCYYNTSSSWKEIATLTPTQMSQFALLNQKTQETSAEDLKSTFPKRPPLVFIKQLQANNYCTSNLINPSYELINKKLITRQVHMAAASWSWTVPTLTTSEEKTLEAGASLSLTNSECNSSTGGALDFVDGLFSVNEDSWTGTSSTSTPRFVMSGSDVTESCQSRYGIQDLTGNVEEWNTDRFHNYIDVGLNPIGKNYPAPPDETLEDFMLDSSYNPYSYQTIETYIARILGTSALTDFSWVAGGNGLTSFYLPLGTPTAPLAPDDDTVLSTYAYFNDDIVDYANALPGGVAAEPTVNNGELFGVTSGGNYTDISGAGKYTLRFRTIGHDDNADNDTSDPGDIDSSTTEENIYTGFRCMIRVP